MNKDEEIISMLQKIIENQDKHSRILSEHSQILNEHSQILKGHSQILNEHSQKHDNHATQLKEHGQILSALRNGQEYLKAEIDQMKITNAKEFGSIKEQMNHISANQDLLREDVWQNKVDTHRIKNTLGMK